MNYLGNVFLAERFISPDSDKKYSVSLVQPLPLHTQEMHQRSKGGADFDLGTHLAREGFLESLLVTALELFIGSISSPM